MNAVDWASVSRFAGLEALRDFLLFGGIARWNRTRLFFG
jgi:hypothetical protein